jgi:hypothetical protein
MYFNVRFITVCVFYWLVKLQHRDEGALRQAVPLLHPRVILVTNLFHKRYSLTAFKKLYHLRWGIETAYAFLKGRLEVENFSSVLPCGILQDMYGAIVLMNLLGSFALDLCQAHPLPEGKAIWWAEMIRLYKTCLFALFRYKRIHPPFLEKLLLEASQFRVNVISGRSFERVIHHKTARFSQNNRGF